MVTRVLATSIAREVTGAEHSLLNLAPALAAHDVTVILAAPGGTALEKAWCDKGLEFVVVDFPERGGFRDSTGTRVNAVTDLLRLPVSTLLAIMRVAAAARRVEADVIHSNCILTHFDCAFAALSSRRKAVLELHEIVAPGIGRVALGFAAVLAARALAISTAVADQLPRWARGKATVIPQGIELERFGPHGPDDRWRDRLSANPAAPLVIAVGRIDPEKALHITIRAVAAVRAAGVDAHLAVIGGPGKDDGTYLAELIDLAAELLPGAFHHEPPVPDVAPIMRSADVLVSTSTEEPFGLAILEAQACGLPVVSSASGGPLDFITDGETGLLVPVGDPDATARAIERLLTEPELATRIVAGAQTVLVGSFTAAVRAQRVSELYTKVVST
ncbi:glycosyltransferase family 4 protein [Mycolicibacterium mengxianglii]|uniref:glycosyltransferase family 4 protein n=1 Tax=Mycolicibacterium mengxianglii TaxID=2736649 RepID=UPI0018D112FE|nr:glycosyltransferase family 4 protein [Mycolicibacterium mengxianglii]